MLELRALLRALSRNRVASIAAICLIGSGVAAATATFAAADAVLWRALPYPDAGRLALLSTSSGAGDAAVSLPDFLLARDALAPASVSASGAFVPEYALTGLGEPRQIRGRVLSAGYFDTLGIRLVAGREFTRDEERSGSGSAVILTDRAWEQLFGRRQVVGASVSLNGRLHAIVGILPPFRDYLGDVDVYVPYQFAPTLPRTIKLFTPVVRVTPSQSVEALARAVAVVNREVARVEPGAKLRVASLASSVAGRSRARAQTLFAAGIGLLVIAMLNFTMLMAARAAQRQQELAIRASLGASRWRLRLLAGTEAAALSAAGVALALELTNLAMPLLQHAIGADAVNAVSLDARVLAFALAAAVLAVTTSTAVATRTDRHRLSSRGAIGGRFATGRGFVVTQLALSVALGVSSIVLVRTFVAERNVDPGFAVSGRYATRIALPAGTYADVARRLVFWRSLNDRLQADGTEAAIATELPLTSEDNPTPFVATAADGRAITVKLRSVSPNYFSVMRMHIRDGRGLAATDIRSAPMAVVVNEHMARLLDRSQPAVGQVLTFDFGGGPVRADVVGVVSDIRHAGLNRSPFAESYFSFEQTPLTTYSLVVASRRPIADVARRLRGVLDSIDPAQPFAPLIAYTEHIDRSLSGARLQMQVVGMFSLAAAAIAAFGVYGLLMFIVTNCRREWALRLAMGAAPGDILRMVLRQSMTYAVAGVALGLAVFGIAARWLKAVVYGVQLWDPTVILAYAVLMAMVCIAAASIPAWRAAAISPSECLRA